MQQHQLVRSPTYLPPCDFMQGVDNVRGYDYKSLSPTVNGNLIGGRYTYLARIIFEHHLFQKISALVFYNVGSAFNTFHNMVGDQGAGLGVA